MINNIKSDNSTKKRNRFKIPIVRVSIKNNKVVYENNKTKNQDTHHTR